MSCNLFMRPVSPEREGVGDAGLRNAIEAEFGLPCTLGDEAKPFVRGLAAGRVQGADTLLDAIASNGAMYLWKEC